MIKFLISRPIAVFMIFVAIILLGLVASTIIPTSLMPNISIPKITVQVDYANNSARELETNVIRPLRNQLLQINNLKNVTSETRDGFAQLKLDFKYGTNTNLAFIETNEKIDASLNYLPKNIDRPKVIKASATDIPVINLIVSLKEEFSDDNFLELSNFAEKILKKRIEQLPNVALADISGLSEPEILITPNIDKLRELGISNNQLISVIKQNNFQLGNLLVQNGSYLYNFKFSNPLRTVKDIKKIFLNINDKLFQLQDLAKVNLLPKKDKGSIYSNGKRAIAIAIIKQTNSRVSDLKESLDNLTQSFIKDYPNLEFSTNQDQSKLLNLSINNLKSSLWLGSFLAIIIIFFFLNDIKSPIIIAISIPTSLIISILLIYLFNLSINIISLSGLVLGVGMMIDNAIIVIDNINQKEKHGYNLLDSCIAGTNEIIVPLISSALTTCSVFFPLLFLSGLTGTLFYDQAIVVSIGLGSSLIVSIFLIPVIYRQLKNRNFKIEKRLRLNVKTQYLENLYEKGYYYFVGRKKIVIGISLMSTLLAFVLVYRMPYSQLPSMNQNEVILDIDWNENVNVYENQERITEVFEKNKDIKTIFSQVGEQQFLLQNRENTKSSSEANIYIQLHSNDIDEFKVLIQKSIKNLYPETTIKISKPKNIFQYLFGNEKDKLIAYIFSKKNIEVPPENELIQIQKLLGASTSSKQALKKVNTIKILREKVLLYNVNYDDLITELKTAFNQNFVDNLKTAQKFIPIQLNYDIASLDKTISSLFVRNQQNELIAIRNLIKVYPKEQYKTINANKNGEYLAFNIKAQNNINDKVNEIKTLFRFQDNLNIRFDGNYFDLQKILNELIVVIFVAIFLLYFIMAAQFESLWLPVIILLEIPIDIGGALFLLWCFGGTINIMAVIGIIVMSGVIINDSILKLHTINLLIKKGLDINDAIKKGGVLRLKPILMTSLTTILALVPFLFMKGLGAELQKPLALTVIGGMIIGTFISLYFIPIMYATMYKLTHR